MKRNFLIILVTMILIGTILAGCTTQSPSASPTQTSTPVSAPDKPIELKIACFQNAKAPYTVAMEEWAKKIEEETGNKVKFTMYAGETLVKAAATYDATVTGVADVCQVITGYTSGRFSLSEVILLPFLGYKTSEHATKSLWDVWEKSPEMQAQYKDTHVLWLVGATPRQFLATKPIPHVEDVKGKRIRAPGFEGLIIEALGGSPVNISGPETYDALEKGVLDATFHPWEGAMSYRFYEVAKHFTNASVNTGGLFIAVMNLNKWNSLPEDVKVVINKHSGRDTAIEHSVNTWDKVEAEYYTWLNENTDVTFYDWTNEDMTKGKEMTQSVTDSWIAEQEAKGLPAKKIYDQILEATKKYQQQ